MDWKLGGLILAGLVAAAPAHAQDGQWAHWQETDRMSDETVRHANILSKELFELRAPYDGIRQRAKLELRAHPKLGRDVILSIQQGQIVCGYSSCPVTIRVGDGRPVTLKGSPASDGSPEYVFIPWFNQLVKSLSAGNTPILVQVDIYRHGIYTFEFDAAGFDPGWLK